LKTAGGVAAVGTLRDISVSGAFIATAASMKLHEQVQLRVYSGPQGRDLLGSFDAHIVRRDGGVGVGIEWNELAPQSLALLEEHGGEGRSRHRASSTRSRKHDGHDGHDGHAPHDGHGMIDGDGARIPAEPEVMRRRGSRLR
jgi:hypothetical protein